MGRLSVSDDEMAPVALVCCVDGLLQFGRVGKRFALDQLCRDLDPRVGASDAFEHLVDDGVGVDDLAGKAEVDGECVVDDDDPRWRGRHAEVSGVGEHGAGHRPVDAVPALGELRVGRPRDPRLRSFVASVCSSRAHFPDGVVGGVMLKRNAQVGHGQRQIADIGAHDDRRGRQLCRERGNPQVHRVGTHLGRRSRSLGGNDDRCVGRSRLNRRHGSGRSGSIRRVPDGQYGCAEDRGHHDCGRRDDRPARGPRRPVHGG